ncbi:tail assembly chaperone [Listeria fleischmannii]|uniref:Prophage minor tail protein n=1 Tax=Listeria fleischmannii FSL S10-1203 TaxID=1265822 RepID=W7DIM9_9LIST|nr:tail assembly chaperone [Listeria fleischmannii]EUJ64744.1 prophage minor tail protein [Listeria fleischmannii FSL S10-1203]
MTKQTVKIGKNVYTLNKGIGTFKALGLMPNQIEENIEGLGNIVLSLQTGEPFTIVEILKAALSTEDITDEDIENYVFEADADIEKLSEDLLSFFKNSAFKKTFNIVNEQADKMMKSMDDVMENVMSEIQNLNTDES